MSPKQIKFNKPIHHLMIITADNFLTEKHGKDCEWLSRQAIIDFAEMYAQKFYASKIQQSIIPNDTYAEIKRPKMPPQPITEQP